MTLLEKQKLCADFGYVQGSDGKLYEIVADSQRKKLWINSEDGSAVARFNTTFGVDIHNSATDQLGGAPECLWCTHSKPDISTWHNFISHVKTHFGIVLEIDSIDVTHLAK